MKMSEKPSIVKNQPKDEPLIDIEGKIKELFKNSEAQKGNPRFIEGEGSLKLQREPLKVKGEVVDDVALERHKRMMRG